MYGSASDRGGTKIRIDSAGAPLSSSRKIRWIATVVLPLPAGPSSQILQIQRLPAQTLDCAVVSVKWLCLPSSYYMARTAADTYRITCGLLKTPGQIKRMNSKRQERRNVKLIGWLTGCQKTLACAVASVPRSKSKP